MVRMTPSTQSVEEANGQVQKSLRAEVLNMDVSRTIWELREKAGVRATPKAQSEDGHETSLRT